MACLVSFKRRIIRKKMRFLFDRNRLVFVCPPWVHRIGRRTRQMERDATMTQVANLIPMIVIVS